MQSAHVKEYDLPTKRMRVPQLIVVMVQDSEYTKSHQTLHCKWANYLVCGLYLNMAVLKNGAYQSQFQQVLHC